MATYTSTAALAQAQRERGKRVQKAASRAAEEAAKEGARIVEEQAKALLSGGISSKQLARLGHPFHRVAHTQTRSLRRKYTRAQSRSRKAFQQAAGGFVPLLPINAQSGRLLDEMQVYPAKSGRGYVLRARNNAPYAGFVLDPANQGTKNTRPRGFWKKLRAQATPVLRQLLRERAKAAKQQAEASGR